MSVHTFELNDQAEAVIGGLMSGLRLTTTADVISGALAVADDARHCAGPDTVTVITGRRGDTKIDLAS